MNGWGKKSVSDILKNDLYTPHGFEEVSTLVSEKVAATLDPEAVHGLWVWNRRKARKWKEWSSEKNKFVTHYSYEERPKAEWVFVPVEDAGIAPEVVESARENPGGRKWMPTENGVRRRFWELRGIAKCASCGSTLSPHAPNRTNLYYTCHRRQNANRKHCENRRYYPAEKLERAVLDTMRDLLDKREYFLERFEVHATEERRKLRSLATAGSAASWSQELDKIESRRDGFLELAADGVIDRDELRRKLSTVDAERDRLRAGLDAARTYANDATELEVHLSRTRELIKDASRDWLDSRASGEDRASMYRRLRLRVEVDGEDNMRLEGVFGVRSVWVNATHSPGW